MHIVLSDVEYNGTAFLLDFNARLGYNTEVYIFKIVTAWNLD